MFVYSFRDEYLAAWRKAGKFSNVFNIEVNINFIIYLLNHLIIIITLCEGVPIEINNPEILKICNVQDFIEVRYLIVRSIKYF